MSWVPQGAAPTVWWKLVPSTYLRQVKGPCILRDEGNVYVFKGRYSGAIGTNWIEYSFGNFNPPSEDYDGEFFASNATDANGWNNCDARHPIDERSTPGDGFKGQIGKNKKLKGSKTWFTLLIEKINLETGIAIGIGIALVVGGIIYYRKKRNGRG